MLLPDVNVLVYAHRSDSAEHARYRQWVDTILRADTAFGVSDVVLSGFVRVVTHPGIFKIPTPLDVALAFVEQMRGRPNAVPIAVGERHWDIFVRLCREAGARGNLVADAYLAAMAIESGCEWITTDRDYSRFDGLRWRHPLDDSTTR
jgi:toxin-antitoxin system PIN domain toxin